MAIATSLVIGLFASGQVWNEQAEEVRQQRAKEATTSPQDMTLEEQEGAPMLLRFVSAWIVPEHPHLVELEFAPEDLSAKPIKSFAVHSEATWENGSVGHRMNFPIPALNGEAHKVEFRVRPSSKVRVWVASVEYEDGTSWKSKLPDAGAEKKQPQ